jgi:hypothetical protein
MTAFTSQPLISSTFGSRHRIRAYRTGEVRVHGCPVRYGGPGTVRTELLTTLTGVHLIGMCLMGVHLTGVHLTGVYLIYESSLRVGHGWRESFYRHPGWLKSFLIVGDSAVRLLVTLGARSAW